MAAKRAYKATRKLGGGQKAYRKWEEWDNGDVLIGKLSDFHVDQYKKNCPVVEVLDAQFKDKTGPKYDGKNLVLNACGMLDKAVSKAKLGDVLQFTYNGTARIDKGPFAGKDAHLIETQIVELEDEQDTSDLV